MSDVAGNTTPTGAVSPALQEPRTFARRELAIFDENSPLEPYVSFTIGSRALHHLVIKIWSHDQGAVDPYIHQEDPFEDSHTWFSLGLLPRDSDSQLKEAPAESILYEIQRNVRASTAVRCHVLPWDLHTPYSGEKGELRRWLEATASMPGARVGVFPIAAKRGWQNIVRQVTVILYEEGTVSDATLQCTTCHPYRSSASSSATDKARLPMISILHSYPDITRESMKLATLSGMQYLQTGSFADLNSTIAHAHRAAGSMCREHPCFPLYLINLYNWLDIRLQRTASMDDFGRCLDVAHQIVEVTSEDDPDLADRLKCVGVLLNRQASEVDSLEDITMRLRISEGALVSASPEYEHCNILLASVAVNLQNRFHRLGSERDLEKSIELNQLAIELTTGDDPNSAEFKRCLATSLRDRFHLTNSAEDLDRGIQLMREAVEATPQGSPALAKMSYHLGLCFMARFAQGGSADDSSNAFKYMQQAADFTTAFHLDFSEYRSGLANLFSQRFDRTAATEYLSKAIDFATEAEAALRPDSPHYAKTVVILASLLDTRFEIQGSPEDLKRAMSLSQKAMRVARYDSWKPVWLLDSLSERLSSRFEATGSIDDITRAIELAEQALSVLPQSGSLAPRQLVFLSSKYAARSRRTGSMADLTKAIEISEKALGETPKGSPDLAFQLNSLGRDLSLRFLQTNSANDLGRAVQLAEEAVEVLPPGDRRRSSFLSDFGELLSQRHRLLRQEEDLTKSIQVLDQALELTPKDGPSRGGILRSIGHSYTMKFERTLSRDDLLTSLTAYGSSWKCETSPPSVRIDSARMAANILAFHEDWGSAADLLQRAIFLLPQLSSRATQQSDLQFKLKPLTHDLASDVAALAFKAEIDPTDVMYTFEAGRGIIAGLLMDMRGDISLLEEAHPELARRFESLRAELESPQDVSNMPGMTALDRRHQATDEFDELLDKIRDHPGFEEFLSPPLLDSDLMAAADSGPIIIINVSRWRCDAILVQRHEIQLLELPDLKKDDVDRYAAGIKDSKHNPWPLLKWLWEAVCGPCLDTLGFTEPPSDDTWHRVWWIPTGSLSQLPLHAAGIYTSGRGSKDTVLDRVISSYASSIRALRHGRKQQVREISKEAADNAAVLVSMHTTPEHGRLKYADEEIDVLKSLCPSLHLEVNTPAPYKVNVLASLKRCRMFHFAGHGESMEDPSQSLVLLKDWVDNPLTVADLRDNWVRGDPPFLAFLSACSTGPGKELPDESIHLTSAFQLLGFRHVVGTLWEVWDRYSVHVAKVLYKTIRDEGMTDMAVCRGLYKALRSLRDGKVGDDLDGSGIAAPGDEEKIASNKGIAGNYEETTSNKEEVASKKEDLISNAEKRDEEGVGAEAERREGKRTDKGTRSGINTYWIPYIHFGA